MEPLYRQDLAYIQATAFSGPAQNAAPEIVRRLKCAAIQIRKVVDMGCGAGPLTGALVEGGFEVSGIASSADLIAIARSAVPGAHFIVASLYDAEVPACEALLAVGEPLTYHNEPGDADRLLQSFFRRVSKVVPVGGMFIFDVIETGQPSLAGRFWSSGEDWALLVDTHEDQNCQQLIRNIETFRRINEFYRRGREIHRIRIFQTSMLCDQLKACGFATQTEQAYGTQPLLPRRRAFFCTRIGRT